MPSMWLDAGAFTVVRHGALLYGQARGRFLCGLARGPSLWPGARIFLWPGACTFSVAWREGLLCGQARGLSVWSGTNELAWGRWPLYRRLVSHETGLRPVMVIYGRFMTGRTGLWPAGMYPGAVRIVHRRFAPREKPACDRLYKKSSLNSNITFLGE